MHIDKPRQNEIYMYMRSQPEKKELVWVACSINSVISWMHSMMRDIRGKRYIGEKEKK